MVIPHHYVLRFCNDSAAVALDYALRSVEVDKKAVKYLIHGSEVVGVHAFEFGFSGSFGCS